jgi:hypothetical protein
MMLGAGGRDGPALPIPAYIQEAELAGMPLGLQEGLSPFVLELDRDKSGVQVYDRSESAATTLCASKPFFLIRRHH